MSFFLQDPNHVISCFPNFAGISEWRGKKGKITRKLREKLKKKRNRAEQPLEEFAHLQNQRQGVEVPQQQQRCFPSLHLMQTEDQEQKEVFMPNVQVI